MSRENSLPELAVFGHNEQETQKPEQRQEQGKISPVEGASLGEVFYLLLKFQGLFSFRFSFHGHGLNLPVIDIHKSAGVARTFYEGEGHLLDHDGIRGQINYVAVIFPT